MAGRTWLLVAGGIAFLGLVTGLNYLSKQKQHEETAGLLTRASECLAGGYHTEPVTLALTMRALRQADVDVDQDERKWPAVCREPLNALALALAEEKDSKERDALLAAVKMLENEGASSFLPEESAAAMARIGAGLMSLWQTAKAAGFDPAAIPAAPAPPPPLLTLDQLNKTPALSDRALRLETLGPNQQDRRQGRYTLKDDEKETVVGFCSLVVSGKSRCFPLPEPLAGPKTQLIGYSEPGEAPLLYVLGEDKKWSVHLPLGERLFTGYAGGAWSTADYVAAVTDDEGRDDRVVVVEHSGGETTRRTIALADLDEAATRGAAAIVIWGHLVVGTKAPDFEDSGFVAVPLPLKEPITPVALGRAWAMSFCRDAEGVYAHTQEWQVNRGAGWQPSATAPCPGPLGRSLTVTESGGALWAAGDTPHLLLDPAFARGAFLNESRLESWVNVAPGALGLVLGGKTWLFLQTNEARLEPLRFWNEGAKELSIGLESPHLQRMPHMKRPDRAKGDDSPP